MFNSSRGYGFIRPETDGSDVFFHVKNCWLAEAELVSGTAVRFKLVADRKRSGSWRAVDVALESAAELSGGN